MKIFVLEDNDIRISTMLKERIGDDFTIAKDTETALRKFCPPYDVILLDHDLGGRIYVDSEEEDCGTAFCRRVDFGPAPLIVVHSYNPQGAAKMLQTIKERAPDAAAQWIPFGPSVFAFLKSAEDIFNMRCGYGEEKA